MITLIKISDIQYDVYWGYNNKLGKFVTDVDGSFYFWSSKENNGAWSSYGLKCIADKLDELNEPWEDFIENNLKQLK